MHVTVTRATGALILGLQLTAAAPAQSAELLPPVRIQAADKAIDVTTGHAAPYVLDFDGDGKRDLLVGEFGDGEFPNNELPECLSAGWKKGGRFANGRVRIYKNHGTNTTPRFEDFEYLRAGGGVATVPIT
jgi:hypothetical protein